VGEDLADGLAFLVQLLVGLFGGLGFPAPADAKPAHAFGAAPDLGEGFGRDAPEGLVLRRGGEFLKNRAHFIGAAQIPHGPDEAFSGDLGPPPVLEIAGPTGFFGVPLADLPDPAKEALHVKTLGNPETDQQMLVGVVAVAPVGGLQKPDEADDGVFPAVALPEGRLHFPEGLDQDFPVRAQVMPKGEDDHEVTEVPVPGDPGGEGGDGFEAAGHEVGGADGAALKAPAVAEAAHVAGAVAPAVDGDVRGSGEGHGPAGGDGPGDFGFPGFEEGIDQGGLGLGSPAGDTGK